MIEAEYYFLKKIESSDIENIYEGLSNSEITEFYDVHFSTLEETRIQMEWYQNLIENNTGIWWGIYRKEDAKFCGAGGFNEVNAGYQKAEIGFWLLKEFWGKGILKKIMPLLFDYGFEQLKLNRIEGFIVAQNMKCRKALEKIEFHYEGTLRESEIKNDKKISVAVYSILKKEWKP